MGTYILRRILIAIPVLIGITIISFVALSLAPGDPLLARLAPEQLQEIQRNPSCSRSGAANTAWISRCPIRYVRWLAWRRPGRLRALDPVAAADRRGDRETHPPTLVLMGTAIVIAIMLGVPFGIITALRQYSKLDYFLSTVTMLMSSTPSFVLGLASIYLFAVWLDILPSGGIQTLGEEPSAARTSCST